MLSQDPAPRIEIWSIQRLVFYAKNPRRNDAVVDKMVASIREYGLVTKQQRSCSSSWIERCTSNPCSPRRHESKPEHTGTGR
jgi:hypothetical protein